MSAAEQLLETIGNRKRKRMSRVAAHAAADSRRDHDAGAQQHHHHGMKGGRHLEYPRGKLFDRKDQLDRLLEVFDSGLGCCTSSSSGAERVEEETMMAEMVLISGYSGTGKSSLVYKFRDVLLANNNKTYDNSAAPQSSSSNDGTNYWCKNGEEPLRQRRRRCCRFISGVFEELKTDPFSAPAEAFSQHCLQLINGNDADELRRVAEGIKNVVGKEGQKILTDLIPPLTRLIGEQPDAAVATSSSNINSMKNRLMFLFQSFVEVICGDSEGGYPLILFLDDLQRADVASLELISALMMSPALGGRLMMIGSFRCNEVDENHPLAVALKVIEHKRKAPVQVLEVQNLTVEATNEFLSETLSLDAGETLPLALAVHRKTEGNIFYTIQLLEQLNEKRALRYDSFAAFRWVWDVDRINREMDLADNVVDVLTARITNLPQRLQHILSVAALIRKTFDSQIVEDFVGMNYAGTPQFRESSYDDYGFVELLDMAVEERLLESRGMGSTTYRFAHDRCQQAACALLPAEKRHERRKQIGKYLAKRSLTGRGEDWMIFVAADHLNATVLNDAAATGEEIADLARLNLSVGHKAVSLAAFMPSQAYFRRGLQALERLPGSPWLCHYQLALELHREAGNSELSIGNFDLGCKLADELLDNAQTIPEKLPTYISLANALSQRERYAEAIELVVNALELFGECPKRYRLYHVVKNYRFVKRAFRARTDDEIIGLPLMTDPCQLMIMELLSQLNLLAFMNQNMTLYGLSNSRLLRLGFERGLCGATARALSAYGVLLCGKFRDPGGARRMGKLAREIMRLTSDDQKRFDALTLHAIALFIDPWFVQLSSVMETLHASHVKGMETGDFDIGFRSFFQSQVMAYAAGAPLAKIDENGRRMMMLMQQYNVDCVWSIFEQFRVSVLTLMGGNGIAGDWRAPYPENNNKGSIFTRIWYHLTRMQLAYYFDEMSLADDHATQVAELVLGSLDHFIFVSLTTFFTCLIAMARAQETGKRKYRTRARKLRKDMKRLRRSRGLNVLHKYYIVEAQYASIFPGRRNRDDIRAAFDKAISAASRAGFTQDLALANELAGEYFLRVGDQFWARHYLSHAHREYLYWKARAKADHLFRKRSGFIESAANLYNSTPFMRTSRIQGEACERQRAINLESLHGNSIASKGTSKTSFTSISSSATAEEHRSTCRNSFASSSR